MTTATSQVEKHFQIHNVYKRSKHLYDVQKLKEEEHLQQIYRRKPTYSYSIQTLDTRVDQSFVNSVQAANKKLHDDISERKRRYQEQNQYNIVEQSNKNPNQTQSTYYQNTGKSSKVRIKAPDLTKMPGRKSFGQSPGVYRNQDQFNNFSLSSPRSKAQLNFSLNSPRSKSSLNQPENQNPQQTKKQIDSLRVTKLHEKNNFNNSVYKCLFDYSKINKYAKYSRKQKTIIMPKVIEHQKIQSAEKSARFNRDPGISQFYMSAGRQSPTHLSFRYQNQSERQAQYQGLRKTNDDFGTRKRKQDMLEKRLNQILKKKKVIDNRDDLCDYKFFNRDSYRKKQ